MARRKKKTLKFKQGSGTGKLLVLSMIVVGIFIIVEIFNYLTSDKVAFYEVTYGSNAESSSTSFKGIALRKEKVVTSQDTGYIEYFIKESSRISKNSYLYGVDSSRKFSKTLNDIKKEKIKLSDENVSSVNDLLHEYSDDCANDTFYEVYDFRSNLNSTVMNLISSNAISTLAKKTGANITINKPLYTGIVLYRTDGLEKLKKRQLSRKLFDEESHHEKIITSGTKVKQGDNIYKVITNDEWSIAVPFTDEQAKKYKKRNGVRLKFTKDNVETTANISVKKGSDGSKFGVLTLSKYVVRYAKSRFINIQILDDVEKGLKIPKSSLVKKELYAVPKNCFMQGKNSNNPGITIKHSDKNDVIYPSISYSDDKYYYLSSSYVKLGDQIIKPESSEIYVVSKKKKVNGVYNINSGYTVFIMVNILSDSDDYYIVQSESNYGLAVYDHIVLDGDSVKEKQIINQ